MPDHQVRPQQADHLSAETTFPRPLLHQPYGHVLQNPAVPLPAYVEQQHVHQEGIPLPADNAAMQGLIQDAYRLQPPYYDVAHNQLHPDYPVAPHVYMQQDGRVAQGIPAYPQAVAPEVQENHEEIFGYVPAGPAVGPQYFPGHEVLRQQTPLPNAPPVDGLRNLAGRYINSPGTRVNMLRIEPGLAGHFEVWIVLEMPDIL
ncbi:hypothetical protein EDB85DRAFT_1999676 [Lactarius pseudohatsudake]|nr:hypothetical protein EDB85DRAFT_1999676 [Lactarius pseudohatsudake]